jgi:hypothetical protein
MSRAAYLHWIVDWFSQRGPIPAAFDVEAANFIEAGLIDSLTVIDLVGCLSRSSVREHGRAGRHRG